MGVLCIFSEISLVSERSVFHSFLLLPLIVHTRHASSNWILFDVPIVMCCVFFSNTQWSLTFILLWRWLVVFAGTQIYLSLRSKAIADYIFVLTLLTPIQIELFLRNSNFTSFWSQEQLTTQMNLKKSPRLTWDGTCNEDTNVPKFNILMTGGSSAGGEFQFKEQPEYFFTTHLHNKLCQIIGTRVEITTSNHAVPDYNTFLIARHKDLFLENINPDLVIGSISV